MPCPGVTPVPGTPPGVRAVFTGRAGGVSRGPFAGLNVGATWGDDPDNVRTNRLHIAQEAGFDPYRAECLQQVHGADVLWVGQSAGPTGFGTSLATHGIADALVTEARGVALVVQGADCVPVLMWHVSGGRVAAAHAGWRGLVAGVLGNTVRALGPGALAAAIGPCIGACCYPVDADVRRQMAHLAGRDVVVGDSIDLRGVAHALLAVAGVAEHAIVDIGGCTACNTAAYFSYRRDGARTGRQAGIVWREESGDDD